MGKLRRASSNALSEKALTVRARFKASIAYATKAIKNLVTKALYQAGIVGGQTAFNVAMADAFKAPVVNSITADTYHGAVGDTMTIDAADDFKVESVSVSIHNAAGVLVEQGNASLQVDKPDCLYTVTQASAALAGSKIKAIATDMAGNTGELEITLL